MKIFTLFTMLFILTLTESYAFLTSEEIEEYNTGILAPSGAKIKHSFDPVKVENIVLGCNTREHSTHFFGGRHHNDNKFKGCIIGGYGLGEFLLEMRTVQERKALFEFSPRIEVSNVDDKIVCSYNFLPCYCLKYCNHELKLFERIERGFKTSRHLEAFEYALSESSGCCREDKQGNIWEGDPEKSIYINSNSNEDN